MADCIYCSKPAGFLRKKHKECEQIFNSGKQNILNLIDAYIENDAEIDTLSVRIKTIADNSFLPETILRELSLNRWTAIISGNKDSSTFSKNELLKVISIKLNYFPELQVDECYSSLVSNVLHREYSRAALTDTPINIDNLLKGDLEMFGITDARVIKKVVLQIFETAIINSLEDGVITDDEEKSIVEYKSYFDIPTAELSENQSYLKFVKGLVLRDIMNGKFPNRMKVTNQIPFVLQKNEKLLWLINDVDYYVDKERREFVGGSQGVSVRIVKGVYYRAGAFKGHPVVTTEKVYMGKGILGFTQKQLYFFNYKTSFRIRYDKIVSLTPSEDGFTLLKDGVTAKPQTFVDKDGWFSYNLIANLSPIDLKEEVIPK
jgi:hypothetical protein